MSYFTELNLIKYEKGDYKTKMSYLADLSGNIIHKSKNFGIKIYTSNSIKRAVVYGNKQTLIFDDKLQLLATVNMKFNQISTNFIGYIECKNESNNTIFVNLFDGRIMIE